MHDHARDWSEQGRWPRVPFSAWLCILLAPVSQIHCGRERKGTAGSPVKTPEAEPILNSQVSIQRSTNPSQPITRLTQAFHPQVSNTWQPQFLFWIMLKWSEWPHGWWRGEEGRGEELRNWNSDRLIHNRPSQLEDWLVRNPWNGVYVARDRARPTVTHNCVQAALNAFHHGLSSVVLVIGAPSLLWTDVKSIVWERTGVCRGTNLATNEI